ncbi:hypothetical protein P171DRAFT_448755 [Karstenula rhodostoma CBS 690.94]|uniref:RING-type domain-containing protein n=1 Tax=Karstenula rhodostoma CBS 690.94 TaxID=1392251 RepID=A0A9P4P7G4_9PLEO|nr:hypothetical protein P171DRAFT_448755 [Karstenula rhodostoma CBS 690.94]
MADYPTREDFVWSGVEQLSGVPEGGENGCPICMMPLVSDVSSGHVPLQNAQNLQDGECSTTTGTKDSNSNMGITTVQAAGATVSSATEQNTENSPTTVAVTVGNETLKSDVVEEPEDGPSIRLRACGHIYHTTCLREWLRNPNNKTCPMCRRTLFQASCRHTHELRHLATLEQRVQRLELEQAVRIVRLEDENATLKEENETLKKTIKNMEKGYANFVSDCTMMFFVAVLVALALYAWWS